MKRISFLILLGGLIVADLTAQTTIPSVISGTQTWTATGNPYTLNSNAVITEGSTLRIMPGVQITYSNNYELSVGGTVEVIGKKDSVITLTGFGNGAFFSFLATAPDYNPKTGKGQQFAYCNFTGYPGISTSIYSRKTGFLVENCRFTNATVDARRAYDDTNSVILRKSFFKGSTINITMQFRLLMDNCNVEDGSVLQIDWPGLITNCTFKNSGGIYCANVTVLEDWIDIRCNTFKKSGGVFSSGGYKSRVSLSRNTFDSCSKMLTFDCWNTATQLVVKQNNFLNYNNNSVIINGKDFCALPAGSYNTINMKNNYWGTTDTNIINNSISDYNENIKIGGKVDYSGYTSKPFSSACEGELSVPKLAGIDELLSIYPNPASGVISLKINMSGEKTIKLMDSKGSVLFMETTSLKDFTIPANSIAPGFYFIEVSQDENRVFKKLILK